MDGGINLPKRKVIKYDSKTMNKLRLKQTIILKQIELNIEDEKCIIYEKQDECSAIIVSYFKNREIINIMVVALPQSGKTGTMVATINDYTKNNTIDIDNIYIITGLSSCEWKEQTGDRMPNSIQTRVFHLQDLKTKFAEDIKGKKNVLIIMDEIHVAAKEKNTIYKAFEEIGLYDINYLTDNDIKIVEFSATPNGTIYDLMKWGQHSKQIQMQPGEGYISSFELLNQGRVKEYKNLCGDNMYCELLKIYKKNEINLEQKKNDFEIIINFIKQGNKSNEEIEKFIIDNSFQKYENILQIIIQLIENYNSTLENINEIKKDIDNYEDLRYHIIRTPTGSNAEIVIENFQKIFGPGMVYHTYDKDSELLDINSKLKEEPEKHTFIFIKEKARCSKTFHKKYTGIYYERHTNSPDDSVITQGLLGRACGYDDNGKTIIYTHLDSIERYKQMWDSNFTDTSVNWNSNTTKKKNNLVVSTGTYNNPKLIKGMCNSDEENTDDIEPIIKKFKSFNEVKNYVIGVLENKRGPNNPKKHINNGEYYECNIRKNKKVWSTEEMYKERKCNVKNGAGYGFRYCYRDTNDKTTLEFWIIHY